MLSLHLSIFLAGVATSAGGLMLLIVIADAWITGARKPTN